MTNLNFDYIILAEFLKENIDFFLNARVQKIQQPTRQELVLTMRNQGETRKLYVNISPKFFHLCFISTENEKKRLIEIPSKPPMFCMLLRKYLESVKIAKVVQPQGERILEFYFETYNELNEKIYLCLAIELMGKHSNVILYNYDTNMIIGCMHNVGAEKSSVREIIGGLPYAYPPRKSNNIISGLSTIFTGGSVSQFIDNYFAPLQEAEKIRAIRSKLLTVTKAKLKKVNTAIEKIKKQSKNVDKGEFYRKSGDLIMSNLFNNQDFVKSIEVMDYETNKPIKIELDEAKTLKENANQFYKLYNKAKITNQKSQEMLESSAREKEYLEQVLYSIEVTETVEDLLEIEEEQQEGKMARRQEGKRKNISSASTLFTLHFSPFTIFIGKNNKQNEQIIKMSRDEDLWFHVHNCAGSHVLLRAEAGQKITDEIIFECAKLAKEHSSAKDSSKVGVIYTLAKNLKKPTGANLGYVTYKGEKEIIID